ncbi:MAG: TonB-dependent receptor family protein [Alistipes sp.]|nr:TonB-dependent receptor family protein [Alistipes sp.]
MKRLVLLLIAVLMASVGSAFAQRYSVSGRVVGGDNVPIAYATVVVVNNSHQVAGATTDGEGGFVVAIAEGDYTLNVNYIGYTSHKQGIALRGNIDLGDIVLVESSEQIEQVVVTSQLIRREADRFVVDIANSPIALGKDGEELLKSAPGVWIQDDKISVNGASGTKIYLNDREVRMEDEQLIAYLRSLRAEDIQKIEVVPQSGADYDASSSGGIIKISTKRRIDSGLMGSVSLAYNRAKSLHQTAPSISLNYNRGKVNAYGNIWLGRNSSDFNTSEHTDYTSGTIIDANSNLFNSSNWSGGNCGIVYDLNDKHSVGGEVSLNNYGGGGTTDTHTHYDYNGAIADIVGAYSNNYHSKMVTATLNYIYKLDDVGSTLKLIGDYTNSNMPNHNDYFDTTTTPLYSRDSTYRDNSMSRNRLATATLALEKVLSPKVTLKAGAKYTYNSNTNSAKYEYLADAENKLWESNTERGYNIGYRENIGALYAIASARLGRLSIVGGLRGEYTSFRDNTGEVEQKYFDLFPNFNLSYSLTEDGAYSLISQYSRTISRPSFWALSPNETKVSEYMIQCGNPNLKASYNNQLSVTAVLKYKYTITAGMSLMQNAIQQTTIVDSTNPELLILKYINYPTINNFFFTANIPVQITKWWAANLNTTGMYMGQRIYADEPLRRNFMMFANAQMSFTLPRNYFIEMSGMYGHGMVAGNTEMSDMYNADIMVKKRLFDNKLTISAGIQNVITNSQRITIKEATFERIMKVDQPWQQPAIKVQISYNFNSGKSFRAKSVESGSAEDRGRISSN